MVPTEIIAEKRNIYKNSSSSSRQMKHLVIKKRPLSTKRSSSTVKNMDYPVFDDKNQSSHSFASSASSDDREVGEPIFQNS